VRQKLFVPDTGVVELSSLLLAAVLVTCGSQLSHLGRKKGAIQTPVWIQTHRHAFVVANHAGFFIQKTSRQRCSQDDFTIRLNGQSARSGGVLSENIIESVSDSRIAVGGWAYAKPPQANATSVTAASRRIEE